MKEQRQKKMGKNHSIKLVFKHYTSYPIWAEVHSGVEKPLLIANRAWQVYQTLTLLKTVGRRNFQVSDKEVLLSLAHTLFAWSILLFKWVIYKLMFFYFFGLWGILLKMDL